jgi:hypothetical protein
MNILGRQNILTKRFKRVARCREFQKIQKRNHRDNTQIYKRKQYQEMTPVVSNESERRIAFLIDESLLDAASVGIWIRQMAHKYGKFE